MRTLRLTKTNKRSQKKKQKTLAFRRSKSRSFDSIGYG